MSKESKQTEDFRKFVYTFCIQQFKTLSIVKKSRKGLGQPQAYIFNVPSKFSKYGYLKLVFSAKDKILLPWPEFMTKEFQELFNLAKFSKPNLDGIPFLSDKFDKKYTK